MKAAKIVFICLLYLYSFQFLFAKPIRVTESNEFLVIGKQTYQFLDSTESHTIESILKLNYQETFKESKVDVPHYGFTTKPLWLHFKVDNRSIDRLFVEIRSTGIEYIEFYEVSNNSVVRRVHTNQFTQDFASREIFNNFLYYEIKNKEVDIYMRFLTESTLQVPIRLRTFENLLVFNHQKDFFQGIYYGITLLIFVYNFFLLVWTRDKLYFIYLLYIGSIGLVNMQVTGYGYEYLWPNFPELNKYKSVLYLCSGICSSLFVSSFLNLRKENRKLYFVQLGVISIYLLGFVLILFNKSQEAFMLVQALGFVNSILLFFFSLYVYFIRKYKPAIFLVIGWGSFLSGVVIAILAGAGVFEFNEITANTLVIGTSLELIVLTIAISDKINFYRKLSEAAQKEAMEQLQKSEKLVREQNIELEIQVEKRTSNLTQLNEELNQMLEELDTTNDTLNKTNQELHKYNEEVKASIQYASRIQTSLLHTESELKFSKLESSILYKPRDIVSGDFYWFAERAFDSMLFIAVVDCTGHGVPGALLTMISHNLLKTHISDSKEVDTGKILLKIDEEFRKIFSAREGVRYESMDIGLLAIDSTYSHLKYSGAHISLYFTDNKSQELLEIKGDRQAIGGPLRKNTELNFDTHSLSIEKGQKFFLFTDGISDQFGGENCSQKFTKRGVKSLLEKTNPLEIDKQIEFIESSLKDFQSTCPQTDDITLLGIKI